MNDWELLHEYSTRSSEAAFRALTDRHLNLVYSVALRQVNDPQLAEEVCQTVFILLARKAGSLKHGVVLAGWLFRTTCFVAARARRSEKRRQQREQEAFEMQQLTAPGEAWRQLAPAVDEALARLGETDRHALLLRFFENKSHKESGAALGMNEEAARKRVDRALEKLRRFFARRGINVSMTVLASTLAAHGIKAAPAELSGSVASIACSAATAVPTSLPCLAQQALNAWYWSQLKLAGALGTVGIAIVWLGILLMPHSPAKSLLTIRNIGPALTPSAGGAVPVAVASSTNQTGRQPILHFRVLAKDTGEPVTHAQLAVNTVSGGEWRERYDLFTDMAGTAEIPYPPDTGRLDVGVLSQGWVARFATWKTRREDPIPASYTLQVERVTRPMGGWLRDSQGRPVADAEISASFDGTGDSSIRETPRERFGVMGEPTIARTDVQGGWNCAFIPPTNYGGFTFKAKHPGFPPTTIIHVLADQTSRLDEVQNQRLQSLWAGQLVTRLESGLTLTGRVVDGSGHPVVQAMVAYKPFADDTPVISTDYQGKFVISNLAAGAFDSVISASGFGPEYRKVQVHAGLEPMEIRLQAGAQLRLRVVDENGESVPRAHLGLEQWGDHRHKLRWSAQSGTDGRIEWTSAPPEGELELYAVKEGWCYSRDIRLKADGEEHQITMRRALDVFGFVTDADSGLPISEFKVIPGYGNGEYAWERNDTRKGHDGKLTMQLNEFKSPWRVRVEAEGYTHFVSDPIPPNFVGTLPVELEKLDPNSSIRGVVWHPDGSPATGTEVALITLDHSISLDAARFRRPPIEKLLTLTDAHGRFSFSPDATAHSVAVASQDGYARVRVCDARQPLGIMLQPWGRIEGQIDPGVRLLPIESMVLMNLHFEPGLGSLKLTSDSVQPDQEGRFVFDYVPPETLLLYLNPGNGGSYHHRTPVTVAAGQVTRVVISNNCWRAKGRFILAGNQDLEDLKQARAYLVNDDSPILPPAGLSDDATKLWWVDYWDSPTGRQRAMTGHYVGIATAADGCFETEGLLPPGDYQLRVYVKGVKRLDLWITLEAPVQDPNGFYDLETVEIPAR